MKEKTNFYWQKNKNKDIFAISTLTILHPCLDVLAIKYVAEIPKIICYLKKAFRAIQRQPIFISDPDHEYILY